VSSNRNRYAQIIERVFLKHFRQGETRIEFLRSDIVEVAQELQIDLPKNLGDIIYSFRYRTLLPLAIVKEAPEGLEWIIRPSGHGRYAFVLISKFNLSPSTMLIEIKIPDATPGIINKYSLNDEQSLLAKIRYNRLIDIFTGLTCYSLQNHLCTTVAGLGQVETDEIYVGLDKRGAHYVIPVQAKSETDRIGVVQIEQDFAICAGKFPELICRPVAAQYIKDNLIALYEFADTDEGVRVTLERHYRLVAPNELSVSDLENYRNSVL